MQTPMVPSMRETGARPKITPKPKQKTTKHVDLSNIDQVPVNADSSHGQSQEAVIKMITKRRSPTMRHVSRNTESRWIGCSTKSIQIQRSKSNMWTPKNQMADMLTKGSFTRDEWNHLLHLLNIMNFSTSSRSHFFRSNRKQSVVMSKRSQEGLSHDSPTAKAKPRPRAMNLVSHRNLSILSQSSPKTNDFEFPGSNFGEPSQNSTESLSLHSQERPQGITSRIGSEDSDENVSSYGNGKPLQGTWNQESSDISGQEYECYAGSGKRVRGTQTQEKKTRPNFATWRLQTPST